MSEQKTTDMSQHFYRASAADFMKTPGSPVAYWVATKLGEIYNNSIVYADLAHSMQGMITGDNNKFLRRWFETDKEKLSLDKNTIHEVEVSKEYWIPYNKGGDLRKWFGNNDFVLNWKNEGRDLTRSRTQNSNFYFKPCITWTFISSAFFAARQCDKGFVWDVAGSSAFPYDEKNSGTLLTLMCSKVGKTILDSINPTLNYQVENILALPVHKNIKKNQEPLQFNANALVTIARNDWNNYEDSWDFTLLPLLAHDIKQKTVSFNYKELREQWLTETQEMQRLEEENNRIFIDAYGLQDELTPEVPLNEITLTCNPHYRYGGDLTEQEREDRLQSDTIAELISYAIGCMMGRYSLDREGLVYAHAGNQGFADLVAEGAYKTFAADDDGILPLTEQEWFSDDVTNRISEFVRTVWGEQQLEENLQFIADSLCLYALKAKKGERALDTIRRYLSNQFYKDHLKTYKRRPIYWLFSSGKHKAFECLVYLHRYHEGTLARMRAEYVIPLSSRINARINRLQEEAEAASSTSERKQLMAELKTLHNQQAELATFDEQLRHHADMRIPLDLDDGVKENYGKFGNLLDSVKAVTGQAAE